MYMVFAKMRSVLSVVNEPHLFGHALNVQVACPSFASFAGILTHILHLHYCVQVVRSLCRLAKPLLLTMVNYMTGQTALDMILAMLGTAHAIPHAAVSTSSRALLHALRRMTMTRPPVVLSTGLQNALNLTISGSVDPEGTVLY